MSHAFSDKSQGTFVHNGYFGDKTGGIHFRKDKNSGRNWYERGKQERGNVCVELKDLGIQVCFDDFRLEEL